MSDTARDYQTIDAAATEGLEDLFVEVSEVQLHAVAQAPNAVETLLDATPRSCTVKEASELLSVPTSTIYRRIKAGKYPVVGSDETGAQIIKVQLRATANAAEGQLHAVASQSNAVEAQLHAVAAQSEYFERSNYSVAALIEMSQKLEAANYRIGWLESQVREREQDVKELKLLTDSQHKPSRWTRFRKWFLGQ
jgi:hypothetical protein